MKRIKKIKHRVAALVMTFFLTLGLTAPAFSITTKAEAMEVLNGACTVADMIFSYCAAGGVAVMNESVINEVYDVYGTSFGTLQTFVENGLLTYSNGQYVDTGLSTSIESAISNVSSLDIGSLFNQTAAQNPTGVALSGAGSLAGIAGSVATTGVLPVIAGVAVSGYCGFQIGTIIANFLGLYDKNIVSGVRINTPDDVLSRIPDNYICCSYYDNTGEGGIICGPVTVLYYDGYRNNLGIYNPTSSIITIKRFRLSITNGNLVSREDSAQCGAKNTKTYDVDPSRYRCYGVGNYFGSIEEFQNAIADWKYGNSTPKGNYSPDIIGTNGNLQGEYDANNNEYTVPDILPQVDPGTQSINPGGLTLEDWLSYVNSANQNSASGDPSANNDILPDILNYLRINTPTPGAPVDPDPDPDPGTVPTPSPNPDPDYDVEQPDTNAPESETPETDPNLNPPDFVIPNIMDKFPFCIPNDIATIFGKFRHENRQAPYISWRFNPPGTPIDYTFNLNLSDFEEIAALLRTLELIAFVVGLAYATRYLIGSS